MAELETKRIGDASIKELVSVIAARNQGGVTIVFAAPSTPEEDRPVEVDIGVSGSSHDVASAMLRLNEVVAEVLVNKWNGPSQEGNA